MIKNKNEEILVKVNLIAQILFDIADNKMSKFIAASYNECKPKKINKDVYQYFK